jgi:hypothetical protein
VPEVSQFEFQGRVMEIGATLCAVCFLKEGLAAALQGKKLRLIQPIALDGRLIAAPIEGTMTPGHGPKEAVEKVEADAKVGIHEAFAVQTLVMNIQNAGKNSWPTLRRPVCPAPEHRLRKTKSLPP